MIEREDLTQRALLMRNEIRQIFIDAEHWNAANPTSEPIDPDPHGDLRKIYDSLSKVVRAEIGVSK